MSDNSPDIKSDNSTDEKKEKPESSATETTKKIAYALMYVYGGCLAIILGTAIFFYWQMPKSVEGKPDDRWLLVFKDGFAFLGGLLATIVGYYFGNRNVNDAIETAKKEGVKAEVAIAEKKVQEVRATEAIEQAKVQEAKATEAIEQVKVQEANKEAVISKITAEIKKDDPLAPAVAPTKTEDGLDLPTVTANPIIPILPGSDRL
jgi:hypothetical protein